MRKVLGFFLFSGKWSPLYYSLPASCLSLSLSHHHHPSGREREEETPNWQHRDVWTGRKLHLQKGEGGWFLGQIEGGVKAVIVRDFQRCKADVAVNYCFSLFSPSLVKMVNLPPSPSIYQKLIGPLEQQQEKGLHTFPSPHVDSPH